MVVDFPHTLDICASVVSERRSQTAVSSLLEILERWIRVSGSVLGAEMSLSLALPLPFPLITEWSMVLRESVVEGVRVDSELEVMLHRDIEGREASGGRSLSLMVLYLGDLGAMIVAWVCSFRCGFG